MGICSSTSNIKTVTPQTDTPTPTPITTIISVKPIQEVKPYTYCSLRYQNIRSEPCSAMLARIATNPNGDPCNLCKEKWNW